MSTRMIKDKKSYRILIIEDNPGDYVLVEDFIVEKVSFPVITHAASFDEAVGFLSSSPRPFDIILLDLTLPDKYGEELIKEMLLIAPMSPIIILTGFTDIDFSIQSISKGIMDYILKDDLDAVMLYKSMVYAIERKKNVLDLKESQKRYSDLFHLSPQPMCIYGSADYRFIDVNKAATDHYGYSYDEFMTMTLLDIMPEADRQMMEEAILGQDREINKTYTGKFRNMKRTGEIMEVETYSTPLLINNNLATLVIAIDVTEKNLYEHKITKAIIKTQEDERYEIGGELHDNVCQILAASQMSLGMLRKSVAPEKLLLHDQCRDNISMALVEIRNLSHRLAPAFFDDSTLEEAIKRLFTDFTLEKDVDIVFHYDKSVNERKISRDIQLNLYRILQEQLRNIQKYAKATIIEINLFIHKNTLNMKVADNGAGFNPKFNKTGIGIANMQRRTALFSGSFMLESAPGKGCTIYIEIPL